jgi:hypothetical protein
MTYKKIKLLHALKDGLDRYIDKYHWTGRGKIIVKSAINEQSVKETIKKNV